MVRGLCRVMGVHFLFNGSGVGGMCRWFGFMVFFPRKWCVFGVVFDTGAKFFDLFPHRLPPRHLAVVVIRAVNRVCPFFIMADENLERFLFNLHSAVRYTGLRRNVFVSIALCGRSAASNCGM